MAKFNGNVPVGQIKAFIITGVLRDGKRFKAIKLNSYHQAMMYNIWQGSVWALLENNKRVRIKQVIN